MEWTFTTDTGTVQREMLYIAWEESPDVVLSVERERDEVFYRIRCATEFTFYGDDFAYLQSILQSGACTKLAFTIDKDGTQVFAGQLRLRKGEWDFDVCRVTLGVDQDDIYTCLDGIMSEEVNILPLLSQSSITSGIGVVETTTCSATNTQSTPMASPPFACVSVFGAHTMKQYTIEDVGAGNYLHTATWMREELDWPCNGSIEEPPPGTGWLKYSGSCPTITWARPPESRQVRSGPGEAPEILWDQRFVAVAYDDNGDPVVYEGGNNMEDILNELLDPCGLTVASDFFNWNPPGEAPTNIAYIRSTELGELMLFQKSEIVSQGSSDRATRGDISLEQALQMLREMFQAHHVVEGSTLRIEHISFWTGRDGLDIAATYPVAVEGQNILRVISEEMPQREQFKWMDKTTTDLFLGSDMVYPEACGDPESEPVIHDPGPVSTDLGGIERAPEAASMDGWFMASTQGGAFAIVEDELNGALGWDRLIDSYYQHWRYAPTADYESTTYTFASVRPNWVQEQISFPLPVADFLTMDFAERLNTEMGWGLVRQGEYHAGACYLVVTLEQGGGASSPIPRLPDTYVFGALPDTAFGALPDTAFGIIPNPIP